MVYFCQKIEFYFWWKCTPYLTIFRVENICQVNSWCIISGSVGKSSWLSRYWHMFDRGKGESSESKLFLIFIKTHKSINLQGSINPARLYEVTLQSCLKSCEATCSKKYSQTIKACSCQRNTNFLNFPKEQFVAWWVRKSDDKNTWNYVN